MNRPPNFCPGGGIPGHPAADPNATLSPEWDAYVSAAIEQAEEDIATEVRMNLRLKKHQLDLLKRAAARAGLPYQTYARRMLMQVALEEEASGASGAIP